MLGEYTYFDVISFYFIFTFVWKINKRTYLLILKNELLPVAIPKSHIFY